MTYIVAYLSLFDGELKQKAIEADSAYYAALKMLGWEDWPSAKMADFLKTYPRLASILDDYCPNTDSYMSVYCLETCQTF